MFFAFFERARPAGSMRPPCLIYLSTSTGVRTGCHYLISLSVCPSVCLSVCVAFVVLLIARAVRGRFPQKIYESGQVWDNTWDVFRRASSRGGRGRRDAVDFVCLKGGRFFRVFHEFAFSNSYTCTRPLAARDPEQSASTRVKGLRQPANLPTENSCPPIPTRCTFYCTPT